MVRLAGFEPATPGAETLISIIFNIRQSFKYGTHSLFYRYLLRKLIFNTMSDDDSADEDSILTTSTMGYQYNNYANIHSLASNSDTSSTTTSSDGSHIIALTSLSDREYESEDSDDSIDLDNWDNYEDDDSIIDEIYQKDMDHLDSDKNDGHYYVGIYKHIPKSGNFLYVNSITIY